MMAIKKNKWNLGVALVFICLVASTTRSFADIHQITSTQQQYEGYPSGMELRHEIWLANDRGYSKFEHKVTITRYDLGIIWKIDVIAGTYVESPINGEAREKEQEKTEQQLHNEGFVYEPEFDWILEDTGEEKILNGVHCRKFLLDGDADYSEEVIEIWAAEELGINTEIRDDFLHHFHGFKTKALIEDFQELKDRFIMYEKATTENPIASRMITEFEIVTLEDTSPPDGIYELPAGLKKTEP